MEKETKGNMEEDMMKRWNKEIRTLYYTVSFPSFFKKLPVSTVILRMTWISRRYHTLPVIIAV